LACEARSRLLQLPQTRAFSSVWLSEDKKPEEPPKGFEKFFKNKQEDKKEKDKEKEEE